MKRTFEKKNAEEGPTVSSVQLDNTTVCLDISEQHDPLQTWEKDGWQLLYLSTPHVRKMNLFYRNKLTLILFQLLKRNLMCFTEWEQIPAFQIALKMIEPQSLQQRVKFVGVTPQSFITIWREPRQHAG